MKFPRIAVSLWGKTFILEDAEAVEEEIGRYFTIGKILLWEKLEGVEIDGKTVTVEIEVGEILDNDLLLELEACVRKAYEEAMDDAKGRKNE